MLSFNNTRSSSFYLKDATFSSFFTGKRLFDDISTVTLGMGFIVPLSNTRLSLNESTSFCNKGLLGSLVTVLRAPCSLY